MNDPLGRFAEWVLGLWPPLSVLVALLTVFVFAPGLVRLVCRAFRRTGSDD